MSQIENAGFDAPSVQDRCFEELFGSIIDYPDNYKKVIENIQNQGASPVTKMACTRYGLGHIVMASGDTAFDCFAFWERYLKVNPDAKKVGATMQSALNQGRQEKFIEGYAKITTIEQARQAIYSNTFVYTGSLYGNRRHVRETKQYATGDNKNGHIFCLLGYDDNGFWGVNSYGPENGYFYIENKYFDTLYSKYTIIMSEETTKEEKKKRDEESKRIAYKYVMSDVRPTDFMTREEFAIVCGRLLKIFGKE